MVHTRHEVIGHALRILANSAANMSANGVKITQQNDVPARVGFVHVAEDLLEYVRSGQNQT